MSRGLAQGRFEGDADPLFRAINDSLAFDYRLAAQDIRASIAWAGAIHRAGVLTADEHARLVEGLAVLGREVECDPRAPLSGGRDEDVHSWVERRLTESLGPLGRKLHTGRSRNDQVATDLRLWTRDAIDERLVELRGARRSLIALARREGATIMPGYTHLQRAQPILFAHWCLAYEAMLERDARRFDDARRRVNTCPLGSGALAGTTYAIDRAALARDLGFDAPTSNSLDAVSDRDFVVEVLGACAIAAMHASRLGEDLVLFGTREFAFVEFDDAVASGSSLMPQKKNPDAAELMRAKAGRVAGSLVSLLVALKGLPLAYNKDLQEDKEPLFEAMEHLALALRVAPRILGTLRVDRERCAGAALDGYANATELADYLVARGVAFRDAHDQVGRLVRRAIERHQRLEDLPMAELRALAPTIGDDVSGALRLEAGLSRREVPGGTGPQAVARAITDADRRLAAEGGSRPRGVLRAGHVE